VDSNVIIFERVREERANGRSLVQSLDAGFRNAMSTIIDANVTTLIAAVIMFYLGSGPIRGFAITLAIGIVTTVFTAFLLTRWMIAIWLRSRRPTELPRGAVKFIPDDTKLRFMRLRNFAFTGSAALSILAAVLFFTVQMNMGIDFRGGSLIEVQAKQEQADISDVRGRLEGLNLGEVQVQEFGSSRDLLIRIGAQDGGDAAEQSAMQLVQNELSEDYDFRRVEVVGPTISEELARAGTIAVIAALFAMLVYIWLRFEWQFAIGAIVATLHDVVMVIGFYVIVGLEFNLSSIAAVLTVVGYSINDTVVVYDRIRENLRKYKKMPLPDLIDMTINQTLSRTILTGLTTLVALTALWLFGGEVIASFTIAMIFGILIGTYSSVFIAGPLLILFKLRPENFQASVEHKQETQAETSKA
jgi:SecD/SecF fusion protein